jgi:phage shock protein PspC (stress-responsive transcriptional regulator)
VSDFEAAEEQYADKAAYEPYSELHAEPLGSKKGSQGQDASTGTPSSSSKKLYRDLNRKIVGGVASGIAHYLAIDPLWIRLIFLATFFDVFFFISFSGFAIISYIILWAITPGSYDLNDETRYKRLFRDPENRVLGGVGAGLAAYFGVDATVIRLLFVLGIFLGGTGLIVYCIFWFITPEAKTLTDRMQMEGEPVTLANIEKKIKESLNLGEEEENLFTKALLFPFRLIAMLIDFLSSSMQPMGGFVGQLLRVVAGAFMIMLAFMVVMALFGVTVGLFASLGQDSFKLGNLSPEIVRNSFPRGGFAFGILALGIPFLSLGFVGTSLLAGRRLVTKTSALTLFGLWLIGLFGAAFTLPGFIQSWQTEADSRTELLLASPNEVFIVDLNENLKAVGDQVELTVRGYDGPQVKLVKTVESHGRDRQDAEVNALMLDHQVRQEANVLTLDGVATYKPNSIFRNQQMRLELYVPYGKAFIMKENLHRVLRHTLYPFGYDGGDLGDTVRWVFDENGLKCLSCQAKTETGAAFDRDEMEGFVKDFGNKDFSRVSISNHFNVELRQSERFEVLVEGDRDEVAKVEVIQEGQEIKILYNGKLPGDADLHLHIAMPSLQNLALTGNTHTSIEGFDEDRCELTMSGAADCQANLSAKKMIITLSEKSELRLEGKGVNVQLAVSGNADANTADFVAQQVNVAASEKGTAHVFASKQIEIASSGASQVTYKGKPKVLSASGNFSEAE